MWAASLVSNFGGQIQSVGASWMMISLAGSPLLVALVQTSMSLPVVLLSLFAGAVADSYDRRKVMIGAQSFMLLVSAILALGAYLGWLTPWALLAMTFLIGCGGAINAPCWQASIGDIVPREKIPTAVAYNSMNFNVARSFGPAVGGAIVSAGGAAIAFVANALSYIGFIVVLWRWRLEAAPQGMPRERIGTAIYAGLRYVAMSPSICVVLVRALLFGLGASAVPAMLPLVARDLIGGGAFTYGTLLGAFGGGAVLGAFSATPLRRKLNSENLIRLAILAAAIGAAGVAFGMGLIPTIIALALSGAGWVITLSSFNVTVQMSAPRWVTGRALSFYQVAAFSGMAAGSWGCGMIAARYGVAPALFIAAAWLILVALAGFFLPIPSVEKLDLTPLERWTEPETAFKIDGRSGPIVVTIEYEIRETDVPEFLNAMNERGRIRRRDGARHWTLSRDLGRPDHWIERYQVPTWFDYVRHNRRRTHEDAENFETIRGLHVGPDRPVVRRMIERQTSWAWMRRSQVARELADPMTDVSHTS